ncbi:MAG: MBL fold metallo-hydrolase [Opitutae bacterium]|nr:MBL fold metallo-hydrolase [Opitutae bacterium]
MKNYTSESLKICASAEGPFDTNMYLVVDEVQSRFIAVDVPPGAGEKLANFAKRNAFALEAILLTHGHWDHNAGIAAALAKCGKDIPVFAHEDGRDFCEKPEKFAPLFQAAVPGLSDDDFPPFALSRPTNDNDAFTLLGREWRAFHVPGHCPGSLAFYCAAEKIVFTGDVLFAGSVGRSDLQGGDFRVLEKSIREKLYVLPNDVKVFPGHGPTTTIEDEKASNAFVRE